MNAADLLVAGIPGPDLDGDSAAVLAECRPGGVILLGWNFNTLEQLVRLTADLRRILPDALLLIDAEGGRVDRLKKIVAPAPGADVLSRDPRLALRAGRWVARELALFGFDVDLAPVVDLDRGKTSNALDRRCFGATPEAVIAGGRAFLRGLHQGGIGGCLKHFPGLGGAGQDTHHQGSVVDLPVKELAADLEPFAALAGEAGAVMVGHAAYPSYDPENRPATLSPPILIDLLREKLGFQGLVMSDDLGMKALDPVGDLADRSEAALAAGCDLLLVCHQVMELPRIAERLSAPRWERRVGEALQRLSAYRAHLETLRSARFQRELAEVRRGLGTLTAPAADR
jgi:beta-N-acetylhexosaminidase